MAINNDDNSNELEEEKEEKEEKESKQKTKKKNKLSMSNKNVQIGMACILGIVVIAIYASTFTVTDNNDYDSYTYNAELTDKVEKMITSISGDKNVKVVITFADNGETVYASDKTETTQTSINGTVEKIYSDEIVLVGGSPLVEKEILPTVLGIVIVCNGGGEPVTRLSIISAVTTALGVNGNVIEVFEAN